MWWIQCTNYQEQNLHKDRWSNAALDCPDAPETLRKLLLVPYAAPCGISEADALAVREWLNTHPLTDEAGVPLEPTIRVYNDQEEEARLTLDREPYTASSGRQFTLVQRLDPNPKAGWPERWWTYQDDRGYWPTNNRLSGRHLTPEAAIERIEQTELIRLATANLPDLNWLSASILLLMTRAAPPSTWAGPSRWSWWATGAAPPQVWCRQRCQNMQVHAVQPPKGIGTERSGAMPEPVEPTSIRMYTSDRKRLSAWNMLYRDKRQADIIREALDLWEAQQPDVLRNKARNLMDTLPD